MKLPLPSSLDALPAQIELHELVSRLAAAVDGPVSEYVSADAAGDAEALVATAAAALSDLADLLHGGNLMATTKTPSLATLRSLLDKQRELPDAINKEVVRLVDKGVPQATIAAEIGVTRQEVNRRYKRAKNGSAA